MRSGKIITFILVAVLVSSLVAKADDQPAVSIIDENNYNASDWICKADALSESKMFDKALEAYSRAIELDPNNVDAYNKRAEAYKDLKEYDKAIEEYNRIISLQPNSAENYSNRGAAYAFSTQYEKAIEDYDRSLELEQIWDTYFGKAMAFYRLEQYDKAVRDFSEAIVLKPEFATLYDLRGDAYANLKQYDKAIKDYDMSISIAPYYLKPYYSKVIAFSLNGKVQNACESLRTAFSKGWENFTRIKQSSDFNDFRESDCYTEFIAGR